MNWLAALLGATTLGWQFQCVCKKENLTLSYVRAQNLFSKDTSHFVDNVKSFCDKLLFGKMEIIGKYF